MNPLLTSKKKGVIAMQWQLVVALVIAIPIILFPAAYVWYMNIGGIYTAIKQMRAKRVAQAKNIKEAARIK
jgi:hypothetical protein